MVLGVFAGFMFVGTVFTYLVPETRSITLEELAGEDKISVTSEKI